jgi:hypothetical protein
VRVRAGVFMAGRVGALGLAFVALAAAGCQEASKASDTEDVTLAANDGVRFWPPQAGRGTTVDARVSAGRSLFRFDTTDLQVAGEGITVNRVQVLDGYTLSANLSVADDAALDARDVTVTTGEETVTLDDAFEVVADSLVVTPGRARIGETVDVELVGTRTAWEPGVSWPTFGDGVDVLSVDVLSDSFATARVTVRGDATPGLRDVRMGTRAATTTAYDAFQIDRVALSAIFDPTNVEQGDTVEFSVYASGTHFGPATELTFWKDGRRNGDVVVDSLNVVDAQNLWGTMTVSNAAELGPRDVLVTTRDEGVYVTDAFTIDGGPLDLSNVGISLSFDVFRGIDRATGAISEMVSASALFYIPLDPACPDSPEAYGCTDGEDNDGDGWLDCYDSDCGSSQECLSGPQPYDANGVFATYVTGGSSDCPVPITVGAGEHVWFESPCNIVQLDRQIDRATGMIYYSAPLTLDDYCFGQLYDLHTQGEEDGIGEYLLEGVQPTVPADFQLLSPQLWGDAVHPRGQPFAYTWTPAMTYPSAYFVTSLSGNLVSTGESGYVGSIPWDDGDHAYTADEVAELAGPTANFAAYSVIPEGPPFGFPFSTIQDNTSGTVVYLSGTVVFE